jgi:hypothetical protein
MTNPPQWQDPQWQDPTSPTPPTYPVNPVQDGSTQPYPPYPPPAVPTYPTSPVQPAGYGGGYGGYGPPMVVSAPTNGLAIAAMICAIAGIFTCVTAPIGAILGHVARKQLRQTGEQGEGMALAGIIVGWSLTGLWVLGCGAYIAFFGAIFAAAGAGPTGY